MVKTAKAVALKKIQEMIDQQNASRGKIYMHPDLKIRGIKITGIDKNKGTFKYKVYYGYNESKHFRVNSYMDGEIKFR